MAKSKTTFKDVCDNLENICKTLNRVPHRNELLTHGVMSYDVIHRLIKDNGYKSYREYCEELGYEYYTKYKMPYDYYCNKVQSIYKETGRILKAYDMEKYSLPNYRWFVEHCPDSNVKDYNDFLMYLGLVPRYNITKDMATKIILEKSKNLERSLMVSDFSNGCSKIGISIIVRHWGSLTRMQKALGLPITQEDMRGKQKSKEQMISDLLRLVEELGRTPTTAEIDTCPYCNGIASYIRHFGRYNDLLKMLGLVPNWTFVSLDMTDEEIMDMYKDFIDKHDFVPSSKYCKRFGGYLPSPSTIERRFGSWNGFISLLGYVPNERIINAGAIDAKDGTKCYSQGEVIIHNFLLDNGIACEKEVPYASIVDNPDLISDCGQMRCDWLLSDGTVVEFFGMLGFQDYDKKVKRKKELLKKQGVPLISIIPKDLTRLDKVFRKQVGDKNGQAKHGP